MSVATIEILEPGERTLEELAEIANREHEAVGTALHSAVLHAVRCGEAIAQAHKMVGTSNWTVWVSENLGFTYQYAGRYMRLAHYRDQLPPEIHHPYLDNAGRMRQPSIKRALNYVRGLPPIADFEARQTPKEIQREAKRLHAQGMSYREIGRLLAISDCAAAAACDPDRRRRSTESSRRYRQRQKQARRALSLQEKNVTARQAGDTLGKAHTLLLQTASQVNAALREIEDRDVKRLLDEALGFVYLAEDAIGKALRVP